MHRMAKVLECPDPVELATHAALGVMGDFVLLANDAKSAAEAQTIHQRLQQVQQAVFEAIAVVSDKADSF